MKCPVQDVQSSNDRRMDYPSHAPVQPNGDFSEFMWMEDMESFDRQVLEELSEQEFLENCLQQMLDEEEADEWHPPSPQQSYHNGTGEFEAQMNRLNINDTHNYRDNYWYPNPGYNTWNSHPGIRPQYPNHPPTNVSRPANFNPYAAEWMPTTPEQRINRTVLNNGTSFSMPSSQSKLNPLAKEFVPRNSATVSSNPNRWAPSSNRKTF